MVRRIVSISALLLVASAAFAGGGTSNNHFLGDDTAGWTGAVDTKSGYGSYCDNNPPKPPTNCVPEPTSMAALAIGGIGFLRRKKKQQA